MGTKPKKKQKKAKEKTKPTKSISESVRGIVRMAETDLDGTKKLKSALLKIKGVSFALAYAILRTAGIDPNTITGTLTDEQIQKLEDIISNPAKYGIPAHLLNRRRDPENGLDKHLIGSKLTIQKKFDIDKLKKIRCYRGIRHELGLPVRGQRTRSSFRTGVRVGVMKKRRAK